MPSGVYDAQPTVFGLTNAAGNTGRLVWPGKDATDDGLCKSVDVDQWRLEKRHEVLPQATVELRATGDQTLEITALKGITLVTAEMLGQGAATPR